MKYIMLLTSLILFEASYCTAHDKSHLRVEKNIKSLRKEGNSRKKIVPNASQAYKKMEDENQITINNLTKEEEGSSAWRNLLVEIKNLMVKSKKKKIRAFISYAWEDMSTEEGRIANSKLQRYLERLRDDLQLAGISVFLDIGDMHGNMKQRMEENLKASDIILTINTPRFKARALAMPQTNLGFEYELTLKKAKEIPYGIFPLHYSGSFDETFGKWGAADELKELKSFLIRDCTKIEGYEDGLVSTQRPLGIIPAIYKIDCDDNLDYKKLVEAWRIKELKIVPPINRSFVGRKVLLSRLNEELRKQNKSSINQKYITITGMGGTGKSDLAAAFVHLQKNKYQIVRWLNTEGNNIRLEFELMASKLGIENKGMSLQELTSSVYNKLDKYKWLLIFDHADNYQNIKDYLPKEAKEGQHILITSRSQHWTNAVPLGVFSEEEAWIYVESILPHATKAEAKALSKAIGYLPLALSHAVSYIKDTGISISAYLETYEKKGVEFIKKYGIENDTEIYANSVLKTIALSMEKVKIKSPVAAKMLVECSYLNPDNIPLKLFENELLLKDAVVVHEALRVLKDFSLIESSKLPDHIQVHRLVQSVIKHGHKEEEKNNEKNIVQLLYEMGKALSSFYYVENITNLDFEKSRLLLPHIETMIGNLEPYSKVQKEQENKGAITQYSLLKIAANTFSVLGDYQEARKLYEKVLQISESLYGIDHPEVAMSLNNLGNVLYHLGNYLEAKKIYEKALSLEEKHYSKDHPEIARTAKNLGNIFYALGDYKEAKNLYEKSLLIEEKHYDKNNLEIAKTLYNLSTTLFALGNYEEAKKMAEQALQLIEKHYGEEHPETALALQNLGDVINVLGDHAGARELYKKALQINEKHYGEEHPQVARNLRNLGNAFLYLENDPEAKRLYEKAFKINERHYNADHPILAMNLNDMGNALSNLQDHKAAKELYEKALQINEKHYGADHNQVVVILQNLGNSYYALKNYKGAHQIYEKVLTAHEKNYGSDHHQVAKALYDLSFTYEALGDKALGMQKVQDAHKILISNESNKNHPLVELCAARIIALTAK